MSLKNYATMDVQLLLGLVNTALRNDCEDLDDLVKKHGIDKAVLEERLKGIDMVYLAEINQFRSAQQA